MTDSRLSFRVSDELDRSLRDIAHEHRTSISEIVRPWLRDLALSDEHREDIPNHLVEQLEREQRIEQNSPAWDRVHFPSRTAYQFKQAFENGDLSVDGLGDAAVEEMREIYVEEARAVFDDEDRQQAAVRFVKAVADHAAQAADASEFDALDPEEMFDHYQGVEESRESEENEEIREFARSLLAQGRRSDKAADEVARRFDVTNVEAAQIVGEVQNELEADR